jgi:hypothetical protein
MSMFFYYMWSYAGIPINKMFFAFAHYSDGYFGPKAKNILLIGIPAYDHM